MCKHVHTQTSVTFQQFPHYMQHAEFFLITVLKLVDNILNKFVACCFLENWANLPP